MGIFHRKKLNILTEPVIQNEYLQREVSVETSICTGEKVIGFKNPATGKLEQEVAVRSEQDILDFYNKYGLKQ